MGGVMVLFALLCIGLYNGHGRTLIDFALGVMAFAYAGMLGVFLTALLTRRGNTVSVLMALGTGVLIVTLLQPGVIDLWSNVLFHHHWHLASTWWMPVGTIISFIVCVSGSPAAAQNGVGEALADPGVPTQSAFGSAGASPSQSE